METTYRAVENHYGKGGILESILHALREMGKDLDKLTPLDLAPVDEFHLRGREATMELAAKAGLNAGQRVLDVGCGLGGSVRFLASQYSVRATGIDLTGEYIDTARALAQRVGLDDAVAFHQAGALNIPSADGAYDVVWTEHAQMNIADKRSLYTEIARVLAPGGRLAFHDILRGDGGPPYFPAPWAEQAAISYLETPQALRQLLEGLDFKVLDWEDKSRSSLEWCTAVLEKLKASGPAPLGLHLLMGSTARTKLENVRRGLEEGRILVYQGVVEKPV